MLVIRVGYGFRLWLLIIFKHLNRISETYLPPKSPELSPVGTVTSAIADSVATQRWLSFLRYYEML